MLVVDRFEEIFTQAPTDGEARKQFEQDREVFLAALRHAALAPRGRTLVILAMRSDFLPAVASFREFNDLVSSRMMQVGAMTDDELREAIEQPAFLCSSEPQIGLTEILIGEMRGQAGTLPLLEFTLEQLWEKPLCRQAHP